MQGLLSLLSQQPQGLAGGADPEMLRRQQLMGLAQGFLQASGPSRMPVGFGQVLAGGLQGQQQAGQDYEDNQLKQLLAKSQLQKAQSTEWGETKDAMGNPIAYNKNDPSKTVPIGKPIGAFPQGDTQPSQQGNNLTGDEFLNTLPKPTADQVKALADGRLSFPGGFALKSPYWQQMISAVSQYDPNFDAINYNSRSATRKDFTSGKSAQNITALNTAMSHLGSLKKGYDALDNSDYPTYNKAANWLGSEFGNKEIQTNTTNVSTDAEAVAHELAKVFRSTGMSEAEIREWRDKITTSAAPAQSDAVIQSALDLMNGRLHALGQQYGQGMGTTKDPLELLSPEAQAAYKKLTAGRGAPQAKPGNNGIKFLGFE